MFNLVNTHTNKGIKYNVDINEEEANVLNYAYALNTSNKFKYMIQNCKCCKSHTSKQKTKEYFVYQQPI